MADISKITLPNGDKYNIKDNAAARVDRGVEYIRGTWTATSGTWTGVSQDTELYDGKKIILFLPFAGSGNVTLNLTMADGSTTGAKNVYFQSTTRMTTHYSQYMQVELIYHNALVIGSTTYEGWWSLPGRDTTDTINLGMAYTAYKAKTVLYRYQILFTVNEELLLPVNTVSNSTATNKQLTTEEFNPFGQIYYYNSTTTVNADAIIGNSLRQQIDMPLNYAFNTGTTLIANKSVYIVAVPQSNGMAKLHTSPISQTLPTTEDGLIYIYLGQARSTSYVQMHLEKPVYQYKNGAVRPYTINSDSVTGVKGNAETSYRTGNVNITYPNLGTAPIANGGTGATTAANARTNLGLGTAATYNTSTSVENNTNLPTGSAIKTYVENHIIASTTQPSSQSVGDIWLVLKSFND